MRVASPPSPPHDGAERIGILLVNSGTPQAPTPHAVRAFLARFLSDPRVVALPRALCASTSASGRRRAHRCAT
jgi:hypothetical protein